jgi:hypothetical protein
MQLMCFKVVGIVLLPGCLATIAFDNMVGSEVCYKNDGGVVCAFCGSAWS